MSELTNIKSSERGFRQQLLTTVSTLVLFASITVYDAKAADSDADRPTVWIELGGELDRLTGQGDVYDPGFLSKYASSPILLEKQTPLQAQEPLPFSFGEEAKLSFQPDNSSWSFQASVRYGRSSNKKDVHHQTSKIHYTKYKSGQPAPNDAGQIQYFTHESFVDTAVEHAESHAIVDFTAGKDVGLGLFGKNSSSTVSFGVRIAQFSSRASVDMRARPDLKWFYYPSVANPTRIDVGPYFHSYHVTMQATRNFHGVGPTLSWTGSTPFLGNRQGGELTFDWGVNGALLFGRQKANVHHQGYGRYWTKLSGGKYANDLIYANQDTDGHHLNKSIIVPNVGGFAGLSFRYADAKLSFGYRADFFFGAIDGGIDTRKSETLGFKGPFASVSVGLGG